MKTVLDVYNLGLVPEITVGTCKSYFVALVLLSLRFVYDDK